MTRWRLAAIALLAGPFAFAPSTHAATSFPAFSAPVVDTAGVVPAPVEQRIDAALLDYQQRSGNQIAAAVVKTTGKQSLEDYAIDLARAWGVGTKDKDDGVLLLIAVEDRKVRIEVGRGLEGDLTDLQSGRIIREQLLPRLRQSDYGGAVEIGTQEIRRVLGDTSLGAPPTTEAPSDPGGSGGGALWILLPVAFIALSAIGGGRRRGRRFGLGTPIIWGGGFGGGMGGGLGGFGGGGGGGFGGGGGGSFGGGGASGGW